MPRKLLPLNDPESDSQATDYTKPNDEFEKEVAIRSVEDSLADKAMMKPMMNPKLGHQAIRDRVQSQRLARARKQFSGK